MKKIYKSFIIVLCMLSLVGAGSSKPSINRINTDKKSKVISVIYDNSSSMFKNDSNDKNYNTRWVEADYAFKALGAMMDTGDILDLYIMGNYKTYEDNKRNGDVSNIIKEEGFPYTITEDREATIAVIENAMDNMKFSTWTYFQGVETAVKYMTSKYKEKECWLVILTDGVFNKPEKIDLDKKLEEIVQNNDISIAYVPIGAGAKVLETPLEDNIITTDLAKDITSQVTDIINQIYGRVQLDDTIRKAYLKEDENNNTIIYPDVPLDQVILFFQSSGEVGSYESLQPDDSEWMKVNNDNEVEFGTVRQQGGSFFTGRTSRPGKEDGVKGYISSSFQYHMLKGEIFNLSGEIAADEPIFIESNADKIDIYYQPAVNVIFEYWQNGERVINSSDKTEKEDDEKFLEEGIFTIKLIMVDKNQNPVEQDSKLLYPDKFRVSLTDSDGNPQELEELEGTYEFRAQAVKGIYDLKVETPWNESIYEEVELLEEKKPIEITGINISEIWVDQSESGGADLEVQITEAGQIPDDEILERIKVENNGCEDEDFVVSDLGAQGNGVWKFRISLSDIDKHQIASEINVKLQASREYEYEEVVRASKTIPLTVTSKPPVLETDGESEIAEHYYQRIVLGESIPVSYFCDGKKLTEEQRKNIEIRNFSVEPVSMQNLVQIADGNIYLKPGWKWLVTLPKEISVNIDWSYERWNSSATNYYSGLLQILYIPRIQIFMGIFILVLLIIWMILCLCKRKTDVFIPRSKMFLKSDQGRVPTDVKFHRKRMLVLPFWRTAYIKYTAPDTQEPFLRSFEMKICRNDSGIGYRIKNYSAFANENVYRINGDAISEDNCIISDNLLFEVKNKKGHWQQLRFEK